MVVMRFADVQWPAPMSLHSMFKAYYKCEVIIIINDIWPAIERLWVQTPHMASIRPSIKHILGPDEIKIARLMFMSVWTVSYALNTTNQIDYLNLS